MFGTHQFAFGGEPVQWHPNPETFEETYEAPRADWDWMLPGHDPLVHRIEQEMQLPASQRPVFLAFTVFSDKFRRGDHVLLFVCF